MKSAIVAATLLTTLAVATPAQNEKRYMVTSWVQETATVTVTGGWGDWQGGRGGWGKPTDAPSSAAAAVAPTSAPAAPASSAPAWSPSGSWAPSAAPSSAPSGSWGNGGDTSGLSDYAAPIVQQHNLHRANHSAPAIQWDNDLASIAQQIAESCVYEHNVQAGGGGYGQNIGAGAPGSDVPKMITNEMYNDEMMYYPGYGGEPDMSNFENWGHFSQIVWAGTTTLGCYTAYCPNGLANTDSNVSPYFTVCNYKPAGNFGGKYGANVLAPQGAPVVTV